MITVYADLNCPFCYALSEWIDEAGIQENVDWRLIDHNPQASFFSYSDQELIDLTEEIFTIRQRAPDINIMLPKGRSNVRNAEKLLCYVKSSHADKFFELKRLVYRAYWAEDCNIESLEVLATLLEQVSLAPVDIDALPNDDIETWTREWDRGPYDRRIPVIKHSDDQFNLGLPPKSEALKYLANSHLELRAQSSSCDYEVRPHIGVLGEWSELWRLLKTLRAHYDLFFYPDQKVLEEQCQRPTAPDLVLINAPDIDEQQHQELSSVNKIARQHGVPVVLMCDQLSSAQELACYEVGCRDVLVSKAPEVAQFKIKRLMDVQVQLGKLLKNSLVDSLTQLQNRRGFISVLEKEWSRSSRSKLPFSLVMMDLDYFKNYNDHYGHLAGDGCLRQVASIIQSCIVRKSDVACRYGGEEFILVLPETDTAGAVAVAENIIKQLHEAQVEHAGSPFGVLTLSIGVTSHRYNSQLSINDLIKDADEQLYDAKAAGRNTYRVKMVH